jgi:hypothetical protein
LTGWVSSKKSDQRPTGTSPALCQGQRPASSLWSRCRSVRPSVMTWSWLLTQSRTSIAIASPSRSAGKCSHASDWPCTYTRHRAALCTSLGSGANWLLKQNCLNSCAVNSRRLKDRSNATTSTEAGAKFKPRTTSADKPVLARQSAATCFPSNGEREASGFDHISRRHVA